MFGSIIMNWEETYNHLVSTHKIDYAWQLKLSKGCSNVDALHRREHLKMEDTSDCDLEIF